MSFREAYPEGARDFTLGESIWFALTSLTPQGGGECPKVSIQAQIWALIILEYIEVILILCINFKHASFL